MSHVMGSTWIHVGSGLHRDSAEGHRDGRVSALLAAVALLDDRHPRDALPVVAQPTTHLLQVDTLLSAVWQSRHGLVGHR